jgi:hypothetical protein
VRKFEAFFSRRTLKPEKCMKSPLIRNRLTTNKKLPQLLANKSRRRSSDLRRLSHELVNHLTVINMSCFKIRGVAAVEMESEILNQIELIEKIVAEAAELLANLSVDDSASSAASPSDPAPGGKVYPLFKSNRRVPSP